MSGLRAQIEALGYEAVTTYISKWECLFRDGGLWNIKAKIGDMLATSFTIYHVVLSRDAIWRMQHKYGLVAGALGTSRCPLLH